MPALVGGCGFWHLAKLSLNPSSPICLLCDIEKVSESQFANHRDSYSVGLLGELSGNAYARFVLT